MRSVELMLVLSPKQPPHDPRTGMQKLRELQAGTCQGRALKQHIALINLFSGTAQVADTDLLAQAILDQVVVL